MIAVIAVGVASIPYLQEGPGSLGGPSIVPRPVVIAILFGLPAGVAAIAAFRGSRPMFIAAGALCVLQSFVSFGGATFGFLIPAFVLIALGLERAQTASSHRTSRRAMFTGALVLALGIAAWVVPFAMTETVCWAANPGPDGALIYRVIPNTDALEVSEVGGAAGCDGGTFTLQGLMLGGVLAIGAVAVAALGASSAGRPVLPPANAG